MRLSDFINEGNNDSYYAYHDAAKKWAKDTGKPEREFSRAGTDVQDKYIEPEMKKRGLKRFVCTRIWNKGDTFKLGILFEYDTKEAFEANVEYLDKHFNTLPKTKELMTMAKIEGSRGISVFEI